MKSIAESMHNFDRENFQRVAAGLPEMQDEQAVKRQAAKTAEIFNELFRQLLAVFPVLANKSVEDLNEMRRQWTTQTGSTGYSNEIYRRKHAQLRP